MKVCSKCKFEKEESEFYSKGKENRLYSYCKDCQNRYSQDRWIKRKLEAIEYKGNKCFKCLQIFPYPVYEFHHRDPTTKDVEWVKLRLRSWVSVLKELDKCDMLCANCHRIVHHELKCNGPTGT